MFGLERNIKKLFGQDGNLFLAAFDHPQIYGVMEGLESTVELVSTLSSSGLDGFILNPGIMSLVANDKTYMKKMIMRASLGGNKFSTFSDTHAVFVSPENALRQGADAILIMMVLGGKDDVTGMTRVAKAIDAFHQYAIPVIVEVLAADFEKNNVTEFVRDGARIAVELGADIVKAFYCDNFQEVIAGSPVPVILAGGSRDKDIIPIADSIIKAGCRGFAFGRNIFQNSDPALIIEKLCKVLGR